MQDVLICFEFWKKCNMFGIVACEYTGTHQSERANGTDTTLKTNKQTKKEMKWVLFLATSTELKEGGLWAEPRSGLKMEVELGSHSHSWTDCLAAELLLNSCFSKHSLHSCQKSKQTASHWWAPHLLNIYCSGGDWRSLCLFGVWGSERRDKLLIGT